VMTAFRAIKEIDDKFDRQQLDLKRLESKGPWVKQDMPRVDAPATAKLRNALNKAPEPPVGVDTEPAAAAGIADIHIKLPHPLADLVATDGGKFILLKLESFPGLMVFDAVQQRLSGSISLPSEDFLFAAGGDKVLVYFKDNNLLQVWSIGKKQPLKMKPN